MPSWMTFNFAAFMPALFAGLATLLAARAIRRRWLLFMILAVFVFAGAQEIGLAPLQEPFSAVRGTSFAEQLARDTRNHLIADIVSVVLGGLIMWRTAKAIGAAHALPKGRRSCSNLCAIVWIEMT